MIQRAQGLPYSMLNTCRPNFLLGCHCKPLVMMHAALYFCKQLDALVRTYTVTVLGCAVIQACGTSKAKQALQQIHSRSSVVKAVLNPSGNCMLSSRHKGAL